MAAIPRDNVIQLQGTVNGSAIGDRVGTQFDLQGAREVLIVFFTGTVLDAAGLDVFIEHGATNEGPFEPLPGFTMPRRTRRNSFQVSLYRLKMARAERFLRVKTHAIGDHADHAIGFVPYGGRSKLDIHDTQFVITISRNTKSPTPPWSLIEGEPPPPPVARGRTGAIDLEMRSLGARRHGAEQSLAVQYIVEDDHYLVASGFVPLGAA